MSGPGLPVNIDTTYADSGSDASVKVHQQHHDTIHSLLNLLDTVTGQPLVSVTNTQTTSYTLVLGDSLKMVEMNAAGANNLTVPPNSSVAFPTGAIVYIRQYGAGTTTIVAGSGVTIRSRGGLLNMAGQYAEAVITKRATDEWVLSGDIA